MDFTDERKGIVMDDPSNVRVSDGDRDAAVERLRVAAVEGRLTSEELTARTDAVRDARTRGALAQVTADLPAAPAVRATGRRWIVSVFGDITRTGSWPPRGTMSPFALFGDIDLDFRQATMPLGEVVINAVAPFGDIDVIVPEGAHVDVGGFTLFGSKKVAVEDPNTSGSATMIRVRGFTLFGSLKVWSP